MTPHRTREVMRGGGASPSPKPRRAVALPRALNDEDGTLTRCSPRRDAGRTADHGLTHVCQTLDGLGGCAISVQTDRGGSRDA
jgi:hypothetical protein